MNSIIICGAASSGISALKLLSSDKCSITIFDENFDEQKIKKAYAIRQDISLCSSIKDIQQKKFDLAVVSPGFSLDSPLLVELKKQDVPLISELEFGWSRLPVCTKVIAITGSNGKSTLTKLCAEILTKAGFKTEIGGNYGKPVSEIASAGELLDALVLEVSSFQLETICSFKPNVAIVLNIFPNHLDRHKSMEEYERLKVSLFKNLEENDYAVINYDFLPIAEKHNIRNKIKAQWFSFGISKKADCFYDEGMLIRKKENLIETISIKNTMFDNQIMSQSAAAAFLAMEYFAVPNSVFIETLQNFKPLPHRVQFVDEIQGISFIDDSKATNLGATIAALKMISSKIRLIAGGLPKGESYLPALDVLKEKVIKAYLIGKAAPIMQEEWGNTIPCENCQTLENAFQSAFSEAKPGETILLSPACASFDQFSSYAERGNRFIELIKKLKETNAGR